MQLSIMNKVKNGELSIEDALNQARMDQGQLLKQQNLAEEVLAFKPSSLNILSAVIPKSHDFSVYKFYIYYSFLKQMYQAES